MKLTLVAAGGFQVEGDLEAAADCRQANASGMKAQDQRRALLLPRRQLALTA